MGPYPFYQNPEDETAPVQQYQQPLVPPAPAPQPAPPQMVPTQVKQGYGVDVSTRGMTDEGLARSGKLFGSADQRAQQRVAPFAAAARSDMAALDQQYGQIAEANDEVAVQQKKYQDDLVQHELRVQDFHKGAAELERKIAQENEVQAEQYIGAYREQIAAVRAMTVDPTGPIGSMSTAAAGGMSLAMFAQGFLAAQGIQIDVSGQLDKWVDRSIHEQERRIQQAEKGAQDQLNLWDLARRSSQDEYEARQRYRGFVLAGMESAVKLAAARFNSSIAESRAKEFTARLGIERDNTERGIRDGYFSKLKETTDSEYQRAYQQGSLANEARRIKIEEDNALAARELAAKKAEQELTKTPYMFHDPGTPIRENGKIVGYQQVYELADPDAPNAKETIQEADQITGAYQLMRTSVDDLRAQHKRAFDGLLAKYGSKAAAIGSEEWRAWNRKRNQLAASVVKELSGAAATDAEAKRILGFFEDEKAWQRGSNARALDDAENWLKMRWESKMSSMSGLRAIPEEKRAGAIKRVPRTGQEINDANTARNSVGEAIPAGAASNQMQQVTRVDAADDLAGDNDLYAGFREEQARNDTGRTPKRDRAALAIETLADMTIRPELYADFTVEQPEEVRREAKQALETLVANEVPYAIYIADRVRDKESFVKALSAPGRTVKVGPETSDMNKLGEVGTLNY